MRAADQYSNCTATVVELFRCYLQSAVKATRDLGLLQAGTHAPEPEPFDQQDRFQNESGQNRLSDGVPVEGPRLLCAVEETGGMCGADKKI